jgi:hypothetical protein
MSIGPDVEAVVQFPPYAIVIFHFTSLLLLLLLHFEVLLDAQVIFCCWKYTSPYKQCSKKYYFLTWQ